MPTVYKAKSPFGRRTYKLEDGSITVSGDIPLKGDFEASFTPTDLDPHFEKLWLRSQFFGVGIFFTSISAIGYVLETAIFGLSEMSTLCLFTLTWLLIGSLILIIGLKKYQIVRFKTKAGVPALDLFEAGPMKSEFPDFLEQVLAAIKKKE